MSSSATNQGAAQAIDAGKSRAFAIGGAGLILSAIIAFTVVVEPAEWNPDLPEAIICDIDGTLAHMTGRSPYDYTRVMEDTPDYTILQMLHDYKKATNHRCKVLIVSGRDHTCRQDTLKWLNYHSVPYDELLMRDADKKDARGNKIPDYVVKYEIYNKHIRGVFNIDYVLDDRNQVVWMWRKLGLKCLQVQEGNF